MVFYDRPDQLIVMMYVCGMGGITVLSVLLAGFVPSDNKRILATQRARYGWIALAVPIAAAFLYMPLHKYGYAECTGALGEIRGYRTVFGWTLTILFFGLLASPLLTFLVGLWIYFKPTMYGKWQRGSYPLTSQVRLRRRYRRSHRRRQSNINPRHP